MARLRSMGVGLAASAALALAASACSSDTGDAGYGNDMAMAGNDMMAAGNGMAMAGDDMMSNGASMQGIRATTTLKTADGTEVGTATATEIAGGGVSVMIEASGMPAGEHGAHIHTVGKCDAPDFKTAGDHWNPGGTKHGSENPAGPHAGDMPNLMIADSGTGTLTMDLPSGTWADFMDADGSALVIHEGRDDLKTDPSGDSGGRIACGVFQTG